MSNETVSNETVSNETVSVGSVWSGAGVPALEYLDTIHDDDVPAAGVDPIESLAEALAAVNLFITRPLRHETIVLWRDPLDLGQGMVAVNGTDHTGDVLDVLDAMADALDGPLECGCDPFPRGATPSAV